MKATNLGVKGLKETIFAKNQPQYLQLPAYVDGTDGRVTTRWSLSWKERLQVLIGGHIWLQVLTFGNPLQPLKMTADCPLDIATQDPVEERCQ